MKDTDHAILYAEDQNGATRILEVRGNARYPERFLTMFVKTLADLSMKDRPPTYYRTLLFLMTKLDPISYRMLTSSEIAEGTGMHRNSVMRAISQLRKDKVVLDQVEGGGIGTFYRLRLNHNLCWAGSASRFNDVKATKPDPEIL
mgnify:CR=1 FL=1